ncbi:hypothetical protein TSAR_007675 [Trichomalopsis sarcophagae]|uniref:Uncharacterized protein n=1 Tax=Trichomalopsis sarcophagae TaxID=543379 RepID=A0A232EG87_9HYME|nr:hypothetical protein TSAR_007675 [Trichomalopsis sarcophagae]
MFGDEVLITESHPITPVLFMHKVFSENEIHSGEKYGPLGHEKFPVKSAISYYMKYEFPFENENIEPDTKMKISNPSHGKTVPIQIPATKDSVVGEAYLRRITTVPGVYLGEAAVTNENRYCYAMAINTRDDQVEIEITPQYLEPFDMSDDDDFFEFPLEGEPIINQEDREKFIMDKVQQSYHTRQGLKQIQRIVTKYSHLFYLPGDPAPRTNRVRHKIRTTDEEPVRVKYKRGSTGQDEEKPGSKNAVLTVPKGMEGGQANLDVSTVAKRLKRRKADLSNIEPLITTSEFSSESRVDTSDTTLTEDNCVETSDPPPIPLSNKSILPSLVCNDSVSEVETRTEAEDNDKSLGESEVEEVIQGKSGQVSRPRPETNTYPTKRVLESPLKDSSTSSSEGELRVPQLQSTMRRSMPGQVMDNSELYELSRIDKNGTVISNDTPNQASNRGEETTLHQKSSCWDNYMEQHPESSYLREQEIEETDEEEWDIQNASSWIPPRKAKSLSPSPSKPDDAIPEEFIKSKQDRSVPSSTLREWMLEYAESKASPIRMKCPLKATKVSSTAWNEETMHTTNWHNLSTIEQEDSEEETEDESQPVKDKRLEKVAEQIVAKEGKLCVDNKTVSEESGIRGEDVIKEVPDLQSTETT